MSDKIESAASVAAAMLVLSSAMLDPRISVAVAVILLLGLAAYRWFLGRGTGSGVGN